MKTTMLQTTKYNALAQQATLNTHSLQFEKQTIFGRQSDNPSIEANGYQLLKSIPVREHYSLSRHAAGDARQRKFDMGQAVDQAMEIGIPPHSMERTISDVAKRYIYLNGENITVFLANNSGVAMTLLSAVPAIEKIFGGGVSLTLQVLVDQDGEDDVSLFACIQVPKPVREAIALRKQFYRDWWMKQAQVLETPLSFEVEAV